MPNIPAEYLPDFELVVNKAINPSEEEIKNNPRARSAKLRVIERIKQERGDKVKKKVKVEKRLKMSKFERLLYTLALFLLVISPISVVFSKATLSKINFEVEKQKKEIEAQRKKNESIAMTIDELASLTKIQEVAEQQGLSYNNDNIKTVQDEE